MPEYKNKEKQQTFTIHFSKQTDSINSTNIYFQRWLEITQEYLERIEKYPILAAQFVGNLKIQEIETPDRILFQQFIDTINGLLDNDFIAVKNILFPNLWKFGVGIISSDIAHIRYQIYVIPYGELTPLVCKLEKVSFIPTKWDPNTISDTLTSREYFVDPVEAGKKFVFEEVRKATERKGFPIYGSMVASDVLFAFVDKYSNCLGLIPDLDSYSVRDLDFAMNHYLIQVCANVYGQIIRNMSGVQHVDLDSVSSSLHGKKITPTPLDGFSLRFIFDSRSFPVKAAFDALQYFKTRRIEQIKRPYERRDLPYAHGANWIWSAFSKQNQINRITRILKQSVDEYSDFIRGNQFNFPKSPYLNPNIAIVFGYEPGKPNGTYFDGPVLKEYHLIDEHHLLSKVTIMGSDVNSVHQTSFHDANKPA
jgi:hypothetical protein